jgi:hypothetical protein
VRLTDLEPQFLKIEEPDTWKHVDDIVDCDGVLFVCPKCLNDTGKRPGCHSVLCWRPHVPLTQSPGPGRWDFEGTGYSDLSLVAGSSSVLLTGPGCGAHFFVRQGEIVMC